MTTAKGGCAKPLAEEDPLTYKKKHAHKQKKTHVSETAAAVNTISRRKKKMQRRPRSHLTANLEARLAELLEIFPVFGIPRVEEGCKSVRALGDAELREATRPLNESAHQSCIIKARLARLEGLEGGGGGWSGCGGATVGLSPGS